MFSSSQVSDWGLYIDLVSCSYVSTPRLTNVLRISLFGNPDIRVICVKHSVLRHGVYETINRKQRINFIIDMQGEGMSIAERLADLDC